jgi:hypothetical protein
MPGGGDAPGGGPAGKTGDRFVKDNLSALNRSNVFRVYLDPIGSDANDGVVPQRPVRSLARAQQVIAAARPKADVEVRIRQGIYVAPPVKWSTYIPGHTITFLPVDYEFGEGQTGISGRPVFRGDGSTGFWLKAQPKTGHQGDTRLSFYFLQVEGYSTGGLTFDGGTAVDQQQMLRPGSPGVNGNTVYGMVFRGLGSKYVRSGVGYGAIDLVNSRNNVIQNNRFTSLENAGSPAEMGLIHGVYLSHHSSGNLIKENRFYNISGDPIRTRNSSSDNKIYDNTFDRTGSNAYFSDWFTSGVRGGRAGECASTGNSFYNNDLISGYRRQISVWWITPEAQAQPGGGCGAAGAQRVHVWGNQIS